MKWIAFGIAVVLALVAAFFGWMAFVALTAPLRIGQERTIFQDLATIHLLGIATLALVGSAIGFGAFAVADALGSERYITRA